MQCIVIVLLEIKIVCIIDLYRKYLNIFSLKGEFLLPREEARRLFRAYIQIWDLQIEENKLQRVLDACARNGNTAIDDALKLLAH